MARPSKTAAIDYAVAHDLTHGLVDRATCPEGLPFVLLKDSDKKGLRVRVTKAGGKHWQFETRIKGKLFTRALGEWPTVSIPAAREEAHTLRGMAEKGIDPREIERQQQAAREAEKHRQQEAQQAEEQRQEEAQQVALARAVTVQQAWAEYQSERAPFWGELHQKDHDRLTRAGGEVAKRGTRGRGKTIAGPLHPLMGLALCDLSAPVIAGWAAREAQTRPTSTRLAWRLLRAFLSWCAEHPQYSALVSDRNPAKTRKTREVLGKPGVKADSLQREQLPGWFAAVQGLPSPTVATYLQVLLLTGARPGEVLAMRWADVNTKWKGLTIKDKVEGERVIPLTSFVAHLLAALPRRNEFVFASPVKTATAQPIAKPHKAHERACKVAAVEGLTLHGLRRSFASLTEWLETPAGVTAQLQGHKPSATAERHYKRRPLDLLRVHHERIEAFILEQAGVKFDREVEPTGMRIVA